MTRKNRILTYILIFQIIVVFFAFYLYPHWAKSNFRYSLTNVSQNTSDYVNPTTANQPLLSPAQQEKALKKLLTHYFAPWNRKPFLISSKKLKDQLTNYRQYMSNPTKWGSNYYHYAFKRIDMISKNEVIESIGNSTSIKYPAITLYNTNSRKLPTIEPSFATKHGFPFDIVQQSQIHANKPVLVVHSTKDGAWKLVITPSYWGWVPTKDIVKVNKKIMRRWEQGPYVAITKDHTSVYDKNHHFQFQTKLGVLFPLVGVNKNEYEILIVAADQYKHPKMISAFINRKDASELPLPITPHNMAKLANSIHGQNYGWHGMYGWRDDSATTQDLFVPFGIWLPRTTDQQAHAGKFISFANMTNKEKLNIIKTKATPFLTLTSFPGYVALYIGNHKGQPYFYQNLWGLSRREISGKIGYGIIGDNVILPANIGANYLNTNKTLLTSATGITLIGK